MILLPATLDGYSPRKDGSFTLRFITQEQTPNGVASIASYYSKYGYLMFKEQVTQEDNKLMDELDTEISEGKTPSQRLRGVLYVSWQQNNQGYNDFKDYYRTRMERIIDHLKNQLD